MSLTPKTRETIALNKADINYIVGKTNYTYDQVVQIIKNILQEVLDQTIFDLEIWIEIHVPKRTGQLRDNLKANLRSSRVQGYVLRLIMGTSIEYAKKINEYTTGQVRHSSDREHSGKPAYAYYYGHYGRIYLDDPQAEGHFFDKMLDFCKERILINLTKAKYKYANTSNITSRQLTRLQVK